MIVDLDELDVRELLEVRHERTGNGIERAVRLTIAREVDMGDTIREGEPAVACETIQHESKPLIAFHVAGTFEEFIQHRADEVLR